MKAKNKNKSEDQTKHKCDFCGVSPEDIWQGHNMDGQYCLEHFREMHEDPEEFDEWYKGFVDGNMEENSDNNS